MIIAVDIMDTQRPLGGGGGERGEGIFDLRLMIYCWERRLDAGYSMFVARGSWVVNRES